VDYPELRETLTRLQNSGASQTGSIPAPVTPPPGSKAQPSAPTPVAKPPATAEIPTAVRKQVSDASQRRPTHGRIGGVLVERGLARAEDIARALEEQQRGDRRRLGEILAHRWRKRLR
jgi:hypothetical protein